ncbi:DUF4340 domain-containing protein [Nitrosomonas communis]|uniref:DUF4340 domain-containing protein n=1 Tax=Nitrosomonas communis TaxID=44574 RepID=A0A1I4T2W9_9PROT|nr:DUF4340 domain-containing protein [Nitrosomonas communis]SFM71062.1 protein of unknown function [Nitrosomonas communis]
MHSHSWLNLIMFVTVIALAAFLYIKPSLQEEVPYKISSLSAETVQYIRITRQDALIELSRSDNRWQMRKPMQGRVNGIKVERILEILSATSQYLLSPVNLSRYGLASPVLELQVDQELFSFGDLAPITGEQYLATKQQVFLISPRYAATLPVLPTDLLDSRVFSEDEIPVEFELAHIHLKHGEHWQVNSQHEEHTLSQDELNQWVQNWQLVHATYLTLDSGKADTDGEEISIMLRDGRKIKLSAEQNESELILLREDEGIRYHFPSSIGKRLLDPFSIHKEQAVFAE